MTYTNEMCISATDRLTLLHSFSFGGAVGTLFSSLLNGAALFPWNIKEQGFTRMATWLSQERITLYHSVPAVFRDFVSTLNGTEDFSKLRLVVVSGAPAYGSDVQLYKEFFPHDCLFAHGMASTEALYLFWYFIGKNTEIGSQGVPVGYVVDDIEIVLLDEGGRQVGFEQTGEIAVKSRYLSPGYWRRPALTKAKFLPDAEGGERRTYLTGDLGRMASDGCVSHLGRKDFQVKITGHRVETGEVETALLAYAGIKHATVTGWSGPSGDTRLVAYFVPSGDFPSDVSKLRNFLKGKVPEYMLPSAFVALDALPLTPNGKVDRLALPAPSNSRPDLDTPFVAPRTFVETQLANIWAEVLELDQVGVQDNFFDLGGHSLAAARVVSRVLRQFQIEVSLQLLFQSPTVAEMAAVIVKPRGQNLDEKELEDAIDELESVSEEEAQRLLSGQSKVTGNRN